jgi:hypothetical protein
MMTERRWIRWTSLLLLALLLASCDRIEVNFVTEGETPTPMATLPAEPTAAPSPTAIAQAATAESPTATLAPSPEPTSTPPAPTSAPPTSPPPTSPLPTSEPSPERIQFETGATSATVTGHVAAYEDHLYVLRAMTGQTMEVVLTVPASDVVLEIWGADGTPLLRHVVGQTAWTGVLYATQDYFINVVSFGSAADYSLEVTIPPITEPTPVRIQFAAGATSATVTGHVDAYAADLYVLQAIGGQTMSVDLVSPASDVVLEIWGADGIPLLRHVTGQTSWTGVLPATQDYFVKVVSFGSAVDYELTVTIPPP